MKNEKTPNGNHLIQNGNVHAKQKTFDSQSLVGKIKTNSKSSHCCATKNGLISMGMKRIVTHFC